MNTEEKNAIDAVTAIPVLSPPLRSVAIRPFDAELSDINAELRNVVSKLDSIGAGIAAAYVSAACDALRKQFDPDMNTSVSD